MGQSRRNTRARPSELGRHLASPREGIKTRPVSWTLAVAGVLAIGGFLALASLRPKPRVAAEEGPAPASALTATPPRRCSCGGACGREEGALPRRPDLAPDSLVSGDARLAGIGRVAGDTLASDSYYRCPLHPVAASAVPGVCPVCRAPLSLIRAESSPPVRCTCRSCPWARPGRLMAN